MKKIVLIILLFLLSVSFFSFIPQETQAQAQICPVGQRGGLVPCAKYCDDPNTPYDETKPCQLCHFFVMLDRILDFVFTRLVPAVAVLLLMIGGVMFFFAGGSPQTLGTAKSIITSVVIGLIIIFAAWLIINTFFILIGVAAWTGLQAGWFTINCPVP